MRLSIREEVARNRIVTELIETTMADAVAEINFENMLTEMEEYLASVHIETKRENRYNETEKNTTREEECSQDDEICRMLDDLEFKLQEHSTKSSSNESKPDNTVVETTLLGMEDGVPLERMKDEYRSTSIEDNQISKSKDADLFSIHDSIVEQESEQLHVESINSNIKDSPRLEYSVNTTRVETNVTPECTETDSQKDKIPKSLYQRDPEIQRNHSLDINFSQQEIYGNKPKGEYPKENKKRSLLSIFTLRSKNKGLTMDKKSSTKSDQCNKKSSFLQRFKNFICCYQPEQ